MTPNQVRIYREHEWVARQAARRVVRRFKFDAAIAEDVEQSAALGLAVATERWKGARDFAAYAYRAAYIEALRFALRVIRPASGNLQSGVRQERVSLADAPEPSTEQDDAGLLFAEVFGRLAPRMEQAALSRRQGPDADDARVYLSWRFAGASLYDIADERGVSQQGLHHRMKLMERVFVDVSLELRAEAA
jgi:DNA-directed RNA polymerase specialized sigma24 family protein